MINVNKSFWVVCIAAMLSYADYNMYGQEKTSKINLSVDVASSYIWRGLALNTSPVLQPSFTFAPGKFSIGAWASTPFTPDEYQEVDIFMNLQFTSSISLCLTDYFGYNYWGRTPSYFNYQREETGHVFDLQIAYDGSGGFPVKAMIATIIAGDDLKNEYNNDGKRDKNFSTYIELGYGNTTTKGVDWEIFAGMVPMTSYFYNITGASFINLGLEVSKSFVITPTYSIPLSVKFTVNPAMKTVYLSAAITLF